MSEKRYTEKHRREALTTKARLRRLEAIMHAHDFRMGVKGNVSKEVSFTARLNELGNKLSVLAVKIREIYVASVHVAILERKGQWRKLTKEFDEDSVTLHLRKSDERTNSVAFSVEIAGDRESISFHQAFVAFLCHSWSICNI